jgi:hypothetical protein
MQRMEDARTEPGSGQAPLLSFAVIPRPHHEGLAGFAVANRRAFAHRQSIAERTFQDDVAIEGAVRNAKAAAGHHVTAWIFGISISLVLAPIIGLSCAIGGGWREPPRFPYGAMWGSVLAALTVFAVTLATIALTRAANAGIARDVRRLLTEGTRHAGRIAAARRVSMTQAKVIIQGETFPAFERMVSTPLSDAALLGQVVGVYTHPSLAPLVILPE